MLELPALTLGRFALSPLALLALPALLLAWRKPSVRALLLACLTALPLLLALPGAGLVGGVVVCALLLRGLVAPADGGRLAGVALLWLPIALLAPPASALPWPDLLWRLPVALTAVLALAAVLQASARWPLALLLTALPFAPFGATLLTAQRGVAELSLPQVAARWAFTGPVASSALGLPWLLSGADRLARCALFLAVLLAWALAGRPQARARLLVPTLVAAALAVLVAQTAAAWSLPPQVPGLPQTVLTGVTGWSLAGLALAVARVLSLPPLLRAPLPPSAPRLDACAGLAASLTLALLAVVAPSRLGPVWLVDPVVLGLAAVLVAALVRTRARGPLATAAAACVQAAAALALAGGAWAGWATASALQP